MKHLFSKRSLLLCLCALLFTLMMTACGKEENNTPVPPLTDLYTQMTTEVEFPATMLLLDDDYITNFYGVELSTLEEYVFATAEDALHADTVILVKMKEDESTEDLVTLMNNLVKDKKAQMQDYLPDQYKIVEKAVVKTEGSYAYLIISSEVDALAKIAANAIH